MSLGSWNVDVSIGSMPEKVATAVGELSEQLVGAEYTPIAYLGSQVVNGINHAVLAEQLILSGKDTKNIVILIFNEKGMDCTLVNVERVVESGSGMGGIQVNVEVDDQINKTAQELFDQTFAGFCGSIVTPIALLGTQVVRGIDYIFACEVSPVIDNGENNKKVKLVTINDMGLQTSFVDLLESNVRTSAVTYRQETLRLSSPWMLFYKQVYAFFAKDSEVSVLFNNEEPEIKLWVRGNDEKAAALGRFIPVTKVFGNVTLNMSVVGDDGQPVPDINCTDEEAIVKAFGKNESVSFVKTIETIFGDRKTYVVFKPEVIQYFADNINDIYGVITTLNEYIARDVFSDTLVARGVSFCTDTNKSLGSPLGEWP